MQFRSLPKYHIDLLRVLEQTTTSLMTSDKVPKIKFYGLRNFLEIPQISQLSEEEQFDIEVIGNVLPFRSNNYVVEELIDWKNLQGDPVFVLNFPQKGMLLPHHHDEMAFALKRGAERKEIDDIANKIRLQLNPHPAGQMQHNIPHLKDGTILCGMQHKYKETVLFFPTQGQTCHAFCSFCFRWPQFIGKSELKFEMTEVELLVQYLKEHPEVNDILFTGGDVMIMKANVFSKYIDALIDADLPNLKTIRIGSKSLSYWPYRYLTDNDAEDMLQIFEKITKNGIHLGFIAHFNHYQELSTGAARNAIKRIQETGAQIRGQSPLLKYINNDPDIWVKLWKKQVSMGIIPYYMFVVRDTGAQHYFGVSLVEAQKIFREAYSKVSGLARTVRGPSMSASPGKIEVMGETQLGEQRVIMLRFLQARNPKWVHVPFFAKYDEKAIWLDQLKPAFGEKFFFEEELDQMYEKDLQMANKIGLTCIKSKAKKETFNLLQTKAKTSN